MGKTQIRLSVVAYNRLYNKYPALLINLSNRMMDQFSIQQWSNYLEAVFELSLKFEVVVLKVLRQKKKLNY